MNSSNIMQRVFDALSAASGVSVDDISTKTKLPRAAIIKALERLRQTRALAPASRIDGQWRYQRRTGAERPGDNRGRNRQTQQQGSTA